ncbi:hypothetical protein GINT2_001067 [Glugoides intestinalis]
MQKMTEHGSNIGNFRHIVLNGLFRNTHVAFLFLVTLLALCFSCYFEVKADSMLSKLSKTLQKEDEKNPIIQYALLYVLHVLFGWTHNHIFDTNIHYFKALIYQYLLEIYLKTTPRSFKKLGTGKTCSIIHKQADSVIFVLKYALIDLFYMSAYMVLFFKDLYSREDIYFEMKIVFCMLFAGFIIFVAGSCYMTCSHRLNLIEAEHTNSHALLDIIRNEMIVKTFNKEQHETQKFAKIMKLQVSFGRSLYGLTTLFNVLFKLMLFISLITPLFLLNCSLFNNRLNKHFYINIDTHSAYMFFIIFNIFKRKINGLKDCIYKIFEKFIDSSSSTELIVLQSNEEKDSSYTCQSIPNILFQNVVVHFDEKLIFSEFNMRINPGEKIAITGCNGVGKSTIIKALLGMIDYRGSIYFNDTSLSTITDRVLHDMISYVPQEPNLFNMSVIDNLKYGKNTTNAEVLEACIACDVHHIFKGLSNGYETIVGENAKNVSGGQAQLINFMRAVIKDAPIFLFDEPTSNLDFATSNLIINKIFTVLKDKTVLLSTHNPSHLQNFDRIINVRDKKISFFNGYEEFKKDKNFEFRI